MGSEATSAEVATHVHEEEVAPMGLKFWVFCPFFYPDVDRPYTELLDDTLTIAKAAESLGFEGIVIPEHHFHNYICNPSALDFATLVAAHTERLRLLTGVLVLPYYHPLALAEEIALVDHISKGRIEVGMARGASKYEFDRLGIDWSKNREMYEEALDLILKAWQEEDISADGSFWRFDITTTIPRPYQQPHPKVWISAQSLTGVQGVARRGLNMMTSPNLGCFAPHGDLDQVVHTYERSVAELGRPRGDVMVLRRVYIDETEAKALEKLEFVHRHWGYYMSQFQGDPRDKTARFKERDILEEVVIRRGAMVPRMLPIDTSDVYHTYDDPIITGPERAIARFKHYEELGVNHVAALIAFGIPVDEVIHSLEVMAKHVLPEFQEAATLPAQLR
jgi:alkanesulfonate monooxygenase SsuD/methylene tetrahydromethanopterin reductase-like flavin-dependent oxidoreductase (luciferase family)